MPESLYHSSRLPRNEIPAERSPEIDSSVAECLAALAPQGADIENETGLRRRLATSGYRKAAADLAGEQWFFIPAPRSILALLIHSDDEAEEIFPVETACLRIDDDPPRRLLLWRLGDELPAHQWETFVGSLCVGARHAWRCRVEPWTRPIPLPLREDLLWIDAHARPCLHQLLRYSSALPERKSLSPVVRSAIDEAMDRFQPLVPVPALPEIPPEAPHQQTHRQPTMLARAVRTPAAQSRIAASVALRGKEVADGSIR